MARPKNIENTIEPRFDKLTIPYYNENGIMQVDVIHKADVTKEHIRRVLAFWDDLSTKDPSFNKESATMSVFKPIEEIIEVSEEPAVVSEAVKASKRKNVKVSKTKEEVSENDKATETGETEVSEEPAVVSENTDSLSEGTETVNIEENEVPE